MEDFLVLNLQPKDITYNIVDTIKQLIDENYLYKVYRCRMLVGYKIKNKYFPLSNPINDSNISVVIDIIGEYKTLDIGTIVSGNLDIDKGIVVVKAMNILCYIKNASKDLLTYTINSKVSVEITDLIESTTWSNIFICNGIISHTI
jgi:hypothetical protein